MQKHSSGDECFCMVDLLAWYSKRTDLLDDLERALAWVGRVRAGEAQPSARRSVRSKPLPRKRTEPHAVAERLTEDQIRELMENFQAGETKETLARKYGISAKSVQRLMRKHGVRQSLHWTQHRQQAR